MKKLLLLFVCLCLSLSLLGVSEAKTRVLKCRAGFVQIGKRCIKQKIIKKPAIKTGVILTGVVVPTSGELLKELESLLTGKCVTIYDVRGFYTDKDMKEGYVRVELQRLARNKAIAEKKIDCLADADWSKSLEENLRIKIDKINALKQDKCIGFGSGLMIDEVLSGVATDYNNRYGNILSSKPYLVESYQTFNYWDLYNKIHDIQHDQGGCETEKKLLIDKISKAFFISKAAEFITSIKSDRLGVIKYNTCFDEFLSKMKTFEKPDGVNNTYRFSNLEKCYKGDKYSIF